MPREISTLLNTRNSPNVDHLFLDVEGHVAPGHSGAPIINDKQQLIGVAIGGIGDAGDEYGWGVLWKRLHLESAKTTIVAKKLQILGQQPTAGLFSFDRAGTNSDAISMSTSIVPNTTPTPVVIPTAQANGKQFSKIFGKLTLTLISANLEGNSLTFKFSVINNGPDTEYLVCSVKCVARGEGGIPFGQHQVDDGLQQPFGWQNIKFPSGGPTPFTLTFSDVDARTARIQLLDLKFGKGYTTADSIKFSDIPIPFQ